MPLNQDPNFWLALGQLANGSTVGQQIGNTSSALMNYNNAQTTRNEALDAERLKMQQDAQARQEQLAQTNKTLEYLKTVDPNLAQAVASGAIDAKTAMTHAWEAQKPKKPNLLSAGNGMFYNADEGRYITPPADLAGNSVEAGLNLVYFKDDQGNVHAYQPLKTGGLKEVDVPEGYKPAFGYDNLDVGTGFQQVDKKTGQRGPLIPKDIAGAESQKVIGKNQGDATVELGGARKAAQMVDMQIQSLKNDPYLPNMLGPVNSRLPNITSEAARVQAKIDQIQGGAFMQARQLLKGGGQITDYEGRKAEDAFIRLNTAQNVADFNQALDEFNSAVRDGIAKLEAVSVQAPSTNIIDNLVNKYGGQ